MMNHSAGSLVGGKLHEPIHTLPAAEAYRALETGPQGLTQAEAEARLRAFGRNALREVKGRPLILKFLANFTHVMAILLWMGGVVGFIARMPQLGIAIWMVNVINGAFSFWQEYKAEKATEALRNLNLPAACVLAAVIRKGELLIPRGDLTLQPADEVLAVVHSSHMEELAALLGRAG